ncbi:hypothetical protein [Stenotrophomonas pictorum]|uniref:hypothetical protein n=1 Tax=Stenotrophomonas pictorum TaxID=86184 RepID=UPI0006D214B2|nr:hypothetical protein [Stenotrophomonas pictorum]
MTRYKAAALHSLLSLALIGLIAAVVVPLWHPWGIYRISGVLPLLAILAGVQFATGPLLTLITYKPGKKTLRLDLAVIGVLQLGFLGVGCIRCGNRARYSWSPAICAWPSSWPMKWRRST